MTESKQPYASRTPHELLKAVMLGLAVLAAGIIIGAGATFVALYGQKESSDREPEIFAEHMIRRMSRELNLTPRQRRQLDPILQEHYTNLQDIRAEVRPLIVAQLEKMDTDIALVLDEEQLELWQQKMQQLQEHFPTFGQRRRGQGPGRGMDPEQRGPYGPREPMGPGYRWREPNDMPDVNELNVLPPALNDFQEY